MIEFLLFCIATVGMTSIIVQGVVFQPFRQSVGDWAEKNRVHRERKAQEQGGVSPSVSHRSLVEWFNELINCAQCTGFWCGLFCGLILCPHGIASAKFLLVWFCCGVGGSFLAALGCNVIDWVFYHKMNALRHLEEQDLRLAARHTELQDGVVLPAPPPHFDSH